MDSTFSITNAYFNSHETRPDDVRIFFLLSAYRCIDVISNDVYNNKN